MTDGRHTKIEDLLKQRVPAEPLRASDDFWDDFRARARMYSQDRSVRTIGRLISIWSTGVGFATALAVGAFIFFFGGSQVRATEVQYIDVEAPHSAVMILTNEGSEGTLVWIEGMSTEKGGGS